MKYLGQFMMILLFSFLGELMHYLIPLQVPGSIYGLVLLFAALLVKAVKPRQVSDVAKLLIELMPLMFVPAGVGLISSWGELRPILLPVTVIMVVSTVLVMGVSGQVTQLVMRQKHRRGKKHE